MKQIKKKNYVDDKNLRNEVSALLRLNHPNLVRLYEIFENSKRIYLVQEYLSGETLLDRLKAKNQLDEEYYRNVFKQIMEAVNYIHKHQIVHRDIKPENFVFMDKDSDVIKMIDFGLSNAQ